MTTSSYKIARERAGYPAVSDTFSVVYEATQERLSHHESEAEARAAIRRYEAADKRRIKTLRIYGITPPEAA